MFFRVTIRAWISGTGAFGDPAFWMTVARWIFGTELRHQNNPLLRAVSDMLAQSIRRPDAPRVPNGVRQPDGRGRSAGIRARNHKRL